MGYKDGRRVCYYATTVRAKECVVGTNIIDSKLAGNQAHAVYSRAPESKNDKEKVHLHARRHTQFYIYRYIGQTLGEVVVVKEELCVVVGVSRQTRPRGRR
jgi:hypothetical protein